MMSDKATLVNEDEYALEHESYGTHLIQVTPLNGFKNEGYVDTESTATQSQSNSEQKTLASVYHAINGEQEINDDNSSTDFIVAMFVVIFDTKRGNW